MGEPCPRARGPAPATRRVLTPREIELIARQRGEQLLGAAGRWIKGPWSEELAIQYAYWAIGDAEYAVLDATLARMDANSLAESGA